MSDYINQRIGIGIDTVVYLVSAMAILTAGGRLCPVPMGRHRLAGSGVCGRYRLQSGRQECRYVCALQNGCWRDLDGLEVVSHINCGLDTSINSACGQPLLVAVVSALVGDASDAQEPGVAGPLKKLNTSGWKGLGESEHERGSRMPPRREPDHREPDQEPGQEPGQEPDRESDHEPVLEASPRRSACEAEAPAAAHGRHSGRWRNSGADALGAEVTEGAVVGLPPADTYHMDSSDENVRVSRQTAVFRRIRDELRRC
jgi:hypothetical protein